MAGMNFPPSMFHCSESFQFSTPPRTCCTFAAVISPFSIKLIQTCAPKSTPRLSGGHKSNSRSYFSTSESFSFSDADPETDNRDRGGNVTETPFETLPETSAEAFRFRSLNFLTLSVDEPDWSERNCHVLQSCTTNWPSSVRSKNLFSSRTFRNL